MMTADADHCVYSDADAEADSDAKDDAESALLMLSVTIALLACS